MELYNGSDGTEQPWFSAKILVLVRNIGDMKQLHAAQCFKCVLLMFSMGEDVKCLLIVADFAIKTYDKMKLLWWFSYLKRNCRWLHRCQPTQPGRVLCRHIRRDDQSQDCPLSHHTKHCRVWTKLHSHLILTLLVVSRRPPAKKKHNSKTSCTTLHHGHLLPTVAYFRNTCSLIRT